MHAQSTHPQDKPTGQPAGLSISRRQDLELIELLKTGDPRALDALMRKYQGNIVRQCMRVVHDEHQSEDLAQEVFLRVYLGIQKYNPDYAFYGWLSRITTNCCIDYLRHRKARPESRSISWDTSADAIRSPFAKRSSDSEGYWYAADRQLRELVHAAIERLPDRLRTVIRLREIEGYSYRQIGERLACTTSAVKSRLFQARSRLREHLAAEYETVLGA